MNLAGIQITIEKTAVSTFGVMVLGLTGLTHAMSLITGDGQARSVLSVGVVAVAAASFHFVAQFVHLLGHALAAWATGYPTTGMVFLYGFAMSQYPTDEPPLPDRTHIQRSLGGVMAFGVLLGTVIVLWLGARTAPQWMLRYLTTFMLMDVGVLFVVSSVLSDGVLFVLRKEWRR